MSFFEKNATGCNGLLDKILGVHCYATRLGGIHFNHERFGGIRVSEDRSRHEGYFQLTKCFFCLKVPLKALVSLFEQGNEWGCNRAETPDES